MTNNDDILILKDETGKEKQYKKLSKFKLNNKYFILYTDYEKDEKQDIKIYASIYNPDDEKNKIEKITDKKEKEFVKHYVKRIELYLKHKMRQQ